MKILYLSFYYEPDLCAGSFRNTSLVKELAQQIKSDDLIHVVTTMPNRYASFGTNAQSDESSDNIKISRISIPKHASGFLDQIKSFGTFYREVRKLTRNENYDFIFASSSRLFTAFLGSVVSRRKNIPLYLDIRDIFVDTIKDVLNNRFVKMFVMPVLKRIERRTFTQANHINLISEGFKDYFSNYSQATFSYFTNGIDEQFIKNGQSDSGNVKEKLIITYAGNIGEGQGLHKIIPEAAKRLGDKYTFRIIGDGGIRHLLKETIEKEHISNVEFLKPVPRKELISYYSETDYLFLHLNDYDAFKKVLPSKVFEYGAYNKPMIAGVSGFAATFIKKNIDNSLVFNPGDVDSFVAGISTLKLSGNKRVDFINKFSRKTINNEMAKDIIAKSNVMK